MQETAWEIVVTGVACCSLKSGKFFPRVDVGEGLGLVVERDFDDIQARVPGVDLAATARQKLREILEHLASNHAEHRLRLVSRPGDGELGACRIECSAQALDEVERQKRRVARHRDQQRRRCCAQPCVQAGERTRETFDAVWHHGRTESRIAIDVLVGVDQHAVDLWCKAREDVCHHRLAVEFDQPLVDAPHAPA
jgi:hypothetical protein